MITLLVIATTALADDKAEVENQKMKIVKITTLEKKAQKEKELLDRENARLAKELGELSAKVPELEENLKSIEGVVLAGREETNRSEKKLEELKKQKSEIQEKISKYTRERAELKVSFNKSFANSALEEKQIKAKNTELDKQEDLTKNEQARLDKEHEKLKKETDLLKDQADAKEKSLNKAQDLLKNLKNELSDLKNKKENFKRSIADDDENKKNISIETQETSKEITKTKAEISNLKIRAEVASKNKNDASNFHKTIAKEAAQLKAANDAEKENLRKIESEVNDLQGMIKAGKDEIERAKKEQEVLIKRGRQAALMKPKLEGYLAQMKIQYKNLIEKNKILRQTAKN